MATPPAPQPVQQPAQQAAPILQEGYIQVCQGYLKRRTTILKRWKKQWFGVAPGEFRPWIYYTHQLNIAIIHGSAGVRSQCAFTVAVPTL